ncbi:MAG: sterol desaturase family protein [Bacteriovoracia bacterium]
MSESSTIIIVLSFFALLFIFERIFPLRPQMRPLRHLIVNGIFTAGLLIVAFFVVRPTIMSSFNLTDKWNFGLLSWLALPQWMGAVLGFLLLDLSVYYWHRVNHAIPFLWRFHNVHHVDPELDVSTSFRFHFGEVALSSGFRFLQIMLIGPTFSVFVIYETIFQLGTFFHHSNLRLPIRIERYLNLLIVTPRMHTIHHSQVKEETNSNFSVVLRMWDVLHRTLRLNVPAKQVAIGVPAYPERVNRVGLLMLLPFRRQRDYWKFDEKYEDGTSER